MICIVEAIAHTAQPAPIASDNKVVHASLRVVELDCSPVAVYWPTRHLLAAIQLPSFVPANYVRRWQDAEQQLRAVRLRCLKVLVLEFGGLTAHRIRQRYPAS